MRKTIMLMACLATLIATSTDVALASWTQTVYSKNYASASGSFGRTTANGRARAMYWKANLNTWVCTISYYKSGKISTPTDNVIVKLMKGGTSPANAALVTATSLTAASWGTGEQVWSLPACYAWGKDEKLWLTFERSGTQTDSNYYLVGYDASASGNATSTYWSDSGTWSDSNKQPYIVIYGTQGASSTLPIALAQMQNSPTSTSVTKQCPDLGMMTPLCEGALYLVYPDFTQIANNFGGLVNTAKTKVPFGLLFEPQNKLSTATGTAMGTISIPKELLNSSSSAIYFADDVTLFSSSTIMQYIGSTALNLFRTLMGLVTYTLCFGFIAWQIKELF